MIRGRLRRLRGGGDAEQADEYIEIDPSELSGLFAAPNWLRDAGFTAWPLVGVVLLLAGAVWLATASGIESLASPAFFLAMTILSLFFLLKDGPSIRSWTERHVGLPTDVAHTIASRTLQSLRGYFLGVTIVAVFSAVLVGGAALVLGIPLAGTIAVVTFIGGYVPYLGAWTAGAFSVLIALGGSGPEAAGAMIVIQLLSNGPLQQIVQPVAYGAALGLHPLTVLVLTIAGGALFGTVGLILAAPITSAIVRISADLSRARAEAKATPAPA